MTMSGVLRPHCGRACGEFSTMIATGRLPTASARISSPVSGFAGPAAASVTGAVVVSAAGSFSPPQAENAVNAKAALKSPAVNFNPNFLLISLFLSFFCAM